MSEDLSSLRKSIARLNATDAPSPRELANRLVATGVRYRHIARHLEETSKEAHAPEQLRMLDTAEAFDGWADQCHRAALELLEPAFIARPSEECRLCRGTGQASLLLASAVESSAPMLSGPCLCQPAGP